MVSTMLLLLAVGGVAYSEVTITHLAPNELTAEPFNTSELKFVLWNAILANFVSLDWNATFGNIAYDPVEVAVLVRTDEKVLFGKWTVVSKRPAYSGYPHEEMIAHYPENLGNSSYVFRLVIPQPGDILYNNKVVFEAIFNETHRTNHSFVIPFIFSMGGVIALSQVLFSVLIVSTAFVLLKIAPFIGNTYCLYAPLDWPQRIIGILFCVMATFSFWYLLQNFLIFAFGPSGEIVRVVNIMLICLNCISLLPPNLLIAPLMFIHTAQYYFKSICYVCTIYVTLLALPILMTAASKNYNFHSCVTRAASVALLEANDFALQATKDSVDNHERLVNEDLKFDKDYIPPKDELFTSFMDIFGASNETSLDKFEEVGSNYINQQHAKCLETIRGLGDLCLESQKDMNVECRKKFREAVDDNTGLVTGSVIMTLTNLISLCDEATNSINCTAKVKQNIKEEEVCKKFNNSLPELMQKMAKAYKKMKLVSSAFEMEMPNLSIENFEALELQLPSFKEATNISFSVALEIVSKVFPLVLVLFLCIVLFQVIRESHCYVNKFITCGHIDDAHVGRKFKIYDIKQIAMNQRSFSVFGVMESLFKSSKRKDKIPKVNLLLVLYVLCLWLLLQYTVLTSYKFKKHLVNMNTTFIDEDYNLEINVVGEGQEAEMFQKKVDKYKSHHSKDFDMDISSCIMEPPLVPHASFEWILFIFFIGFLESKLQVLIYLKPWLTGILYPEAALMNMKRHYHGSETKILTIYKDWHAKLQKMKHLEVNPSYVFMVFLFKKNSCTICQRLLLFEKRCRCPRYPNTDILLCKVCWMLIGKECPICAYEKKNV
ncbi:uncharacterized protein [Palaemon carinicauda]|uniref:uncharacterized protein n=1 Tax=Palaemon carinicauda TaxID=392227 RepID=UPI0035B67F2F